MIYVRIIKVSHKREGRMSLIGTFGLHVYETIGTFGLHVYETLLLYVRISLLGTFISGALLFHNVLCGCTARYTIQLETLILVYLLTTDNTSTIQRSE